MFYAYQESIEIELCEGLIASYVDIIEGELKDLVSRCPEEIEQHLYHHFAGHPDHQCGLWEMSVASIFFGFQLVFLNERSNLKSENSDELLANIEVACSNEYFIGTAAEKDVEPEPPLDPACAVWIFRSGTCSQDWHFDPLVNYLTPEKARAQEKSDAARAIRRVGGAHEVTPTQMTKQRGRANDALYSETSSQKKSSAAPGQGRRSSKKDDSNSDSDKALRRQAKLLMDQAERRKENSKAKAKAKAVARKKLEKEQSPPVDGAADRLKSKTPSTPSKVRGRAVERLV